MYLLLAQATLPDTSILGWMVSSLTNLTSLVTVLTAALIFYGAYYLVANKRPRALLAAYLVLLPVPLGVAMYATIYGSIRSLLAIAATPDLVVTNQDIASGLAASLMSILFAIIVSMPTYVVLAYGLIARDLRTPGQGAQAYSSVTNAPTLGSAVPTTY